MNTQLQNLAKSIVSAEQAITWAKQNGIPHIEADKILKDRQKRLSAMEITQETVKEAQKTLLPAETSVIARELSWRKKCAASIVRQNERKELCEKRIPEIKAMIPQNVTLPESFAFVSVSREFAEWSGNAMQVLNDAIWIDISANRPTMIVREGYSNYEPGDIFGCNPQEKTENFAEMILHIHAEIEKSFSAAKMLTDLTESFLNEAQSFVDLLIEIKALEN